MFSKGILGINARNLSFIKKYNHTSAIMLADNKLKTKRYLSHLGIPFAKTYGEIQTFDELKHFSLKNLKAQTFVIKPNKGFKGRGIIILEKREE
jgi:glutathione synthase/RimK-type ligase-like ATP-grasp enzyme